MMTTFNNHQTKYRVSALKARSSLQHQSCKQIIDSYVQHSAQPNISREEMNSPDFTARLNYIARALAIKIDCHEYNPLAILGNKNFNALFTDELWKLYDFFYESELEEVDVEMTIKMLGTLEQYSSVLIESLDSVSNFWNYDFRLLYTAYINTYKLTNKKIAIVFRELDSLAPKGKIANTLMNKQMISVTNHLIEAAQRSPVVDIIAFENINNINSLHQRSSYLADNIYQDLDDTLQQTMNKMSGCNVVALNSM
ncbi:hypothetical protein A28LD_1385 [Idiomarina sp. A28L]|uniref:hypothetical protein n=1 Tax=Idiomarina sp. A28L TaxID=1036674 RepID=UPI00021388AF|nr:hypothetical protein [Idiomarina sp. A28L]EGN75119.1 hypothetical protein A28LD_1385 [Idiomarina sp. A28L]